MTDEKEQGFKVADKRRYNADGSPRETFVEEVVKPEVKENAEEAVAQASDEAAVTSVAEAAGEVEAPANSDNVVSFPGANHKPTPEEETPEPTKSMAAKAAAASAVSSTQAASHQAEQAAKTAQQAAIENAYNQASSSASQAMPQASFLSLLNMLGVEAAMHLGLMEMQDGQRTPVDMEAARHMLDMIAMLKEKTRGNLSAEEEGLLENVLADLRMQYVALSRKA
jgi:hypothetical protein